MYSDYLFQRLSWIEWINRVLINNLRYVDDSILIAHTQDVLQKLLGSIATAYDEPSSS